MFNGATDFDKDVIGWNVCKVSAGNFIFMFTGSGQPETDLEPDANGQCIDCPGGSTSGSGKYVEGQNPCNNLPCLDDSTFYPALNLWFSNPASATSTYGNIKDW
jgi:hypothetical protein